MPVSRREQLLKICPLIGFARSAESVKTSLRKYNLLLMLRMLFSPAKGGGKSSLFKIPRPPGRWYMVYVIWNMEIELTLRAKKGKPAY